MLAYISERDFYSSDPIFRLIVHDHARMFASLQLPNASHALTVCWRSDLVAPVIAPNPLSSAVWIGVDERFVCVAPQGNTLFSVCLSSPFLDIKHFDECTIALCETQAFAINTDYTIRRICDLREIPADVEMKDGQFTVTFIDGETEALSI